MLSPVATTQPRVRVFAFLVAITLMTTRALGECPANATNNVSPAAGAQNVALRPTLTWQNVGAAKYDVFVTRGSVCSAVAPVATVSGTSMTAPSSLEGSATYAWRVVPIDEKDTRCPLRASSCTTFTTQPACPSSPGTASLVSPADNATGLSSPVSLQWTAVAGASSYRVIGTADGSSESFTAGETTGTSLSVTLAPGKYRWVVMARFGDSCTPTISNHRTFTVSGGSACSGVAATLLSPANGSTTESPVTFKWSAVSGAKDYEIYAALDGDKFEKIGSTASTEIERVMPAATISWYVLTRFVSCPDTRSATFTFTIPKPNPCPAASLSTIAPAAGSSSGASVTFSWTAVANAIGYRVWLAADGGTFAVIAATTSTSVTKTLSSGSMQWYAEALFQSCPSVFSPRSGFTVTVGTACAANPAPSALSPDGVTTTNQEIDLRWNAADGSIGYRVWLAVAGEPFADLGITDKREMRRTLPAGVYSWYVQALFPGCPAVSSSRASFTVPVTQTCPTAGPQLIAPADNASAVASPVTFAWTGIANARRYRVLARLDGATSAEQLIADTDETSFTRPLPPGTFLWRVEALFDKCPSVASSTYRFTVPPAQTCPARADLLLPADGAVSNDRTVTFSWSAVNGASEYVVFVRRTDGVRTAAGKTAGTQLSIELPIGELEWWIATFVNGCGVLESAHRRVTIASDDCADVRPLILTPRNGDAVTSPVTLAWARIAGATGYKAWALGRDGASVLAATTTPEATVTLPPGPVAWFVEATFAAPCAARRSAPAAFQVIAAPTECSAPEAPEASVAGRAASGTTYTLRWTSLPGVSHYEVQESTSREFTSPTTTVVSGVSAQFTHTVSSLHVFYYRVRGVASCTSDPGSYSAVVATAVLPPRPPDSQQHVTAEFGQGAGVEQKLFIEGQSAPIAFTATADRPWVTITPAAGTLPVTGLELTVLADPAALLLGTNTATIRITFGASDGDAATAATVTGIPLSVSLVTPVAIGGKSDPPGDSLIIPAVGHTAGVNGSFFESDVRVANTSAQTMRYELLFTPSGSNGTTTGNSAAVEIVAGGTLAVDDILASFFGATGSVVGMLELRPLTSTAATSAFSTSDLTVQPVTIASSRTFNVTLDGTFGQFIPAIPFSKFIGQSSGVLSLQQIAQSEAFRTNLGILEASGAPAEVRLSVFDNSGSLLGEFTEQLAAGEHRQLNGFLAARGITLDDGRIEVKVVSATGRVSAYASTIDNLTNDPVTISPVLTTESGSRRYVLAGVGDFDTGFAHWKSDVRIFNPSTSAIQASVSYYPQLAPTDSRTTTITLAPGEMRVIDDFIATLFPMTNTAGAAVVATETPATLIVTARTYTDTGSGTYGQFIPAVTPETSIGAGDRPLQILQMEQSSRIRTNIGLTETSGQQTVAEVTIILPDSRVSPKLIVPLAANEFRQFSLASFGLGDIYNVRAAVQVISGAGKVTAYGSAIDQITQDPTYVPAQ